MNARDRAEAAVREMVLAVAELCSEKYGGQYRHGDYAVIIRNVAGADGFAYTWDWFWKADDHGGASVADPVQGKHLEDHDEGAGQGHREDGQPQ